MRFARDLCLLTEPADPDPDSVVVQAGQTRQESGLLINTHIQTITIEEHGGRTISLQSGWAEPLSWLPRPMLGCLIDQKSSEGWGCFARFERESLYSENEDRTPNGADDVTANALGLKKISIAERFPGLSWTR